MFFTILLTAFAVTCLGVMLSATSFDLTEEHIKTLVKNNEYEMSVFSFDKVFDAEQMIKDQIANLFGSGSIEAETIEIADEKIKEVEEKTDLNWYKQVILTQNQESANFKYVNDITYSSVYYTDYSMLLFVESDENNAKLIQDKLIGRLPENKDEIVIPSYIADNIIQSGIKLKKVKTKKQKYISH